MRLTYGIGTQVTGTFSIPNINDFSGVVVGWSAETTVNGRKYSYLVEALTGTERHWFTERDLRFTEPDYAFGIGEEVGLIFDCERVIGTVRKIIDHGYIEDGKLRSSTVYEILPKNSVILVRRKEEDLVRIFSQEFFKVGYRGNIPVRYLTWMAPCAMIEADNGTWYISTGDGNFAMFEEGEEHRIVDASAIPTTVTVLSYPPARKSEVPSHG